MSQFEELAIKVTAPLGAAVAMNKASAEDEDDDEEAEDDDDDDGEGRPPGGPAARLRPGCLAARRPGGPACMR